MARGKTLLKLLDDLRAETGQSLHPGHNIQMREMQVVRLQRAQEFLWDDFAWPHLRVEVPVPLVQGQRFYLRPPGFRIERIEHLDVFRDGAWVRLAPQIASNAYGVYNSDLGETAYPPLAWRLAVDYRYPEHLEIWPVASQNSDPATLEGTLRITGIRNCVRFIDEGDVADLDDRLIVLFAAAEMLASAGDKAAALKMNQAQSRYRRLKADLTKAPRFQMLGTAAGSAPRREYVGAYKPPFVVGG